MKSGNRIDSDRTETENGEDDYKINQKIAAEVLVDLGNRQKNLNIDKAQSGIFQGIQNFGGQPINIG